MLTFFFFFQAEDGIRDYKVTGVQTCALPISSLAGGSRQVIRVVVDDLAGLASDAIVRPATTRLDPTTPVVRRLEQVGGREFMGRLQLHKDLAVGSAVVTGGGGDLPADFVIHAVKI